MFFKLTANIICSLKNTQDVPEEHFGGCVGSWHQQVWLISLCVLLICLALLLGAASTQDILITSINCFLRSAWLQWSALHSNVPEVRLLSFRCGRCFQHNVTQDIFLGYLHLNFEQKLTMKLIRTASSSPTTNFLIK